MAQLKQGTRQADINIAVSRQSHSPKGFECPLSLIMDNHTQISHIAGDLSMNMSPWNKDRIIGQKRPLQISHIWGIRIRLELEGKTRDLALFNMAIDSKLRSCVLVKLKVSDAAYGNSVSSRATVLQQKTGSPVQFEITKGTREAVAALINAWQFAQ